MNKMKNTHEIETWFNAREARRLKAEDKALGRIIRLEAKAEPMIGELCREGKTVWYVWPVGGTYRESASRADLIDFLIRNKYV